MFPYDISINLVRSSDHTRIHGDVGWYGEEEFTVLVYLNPNWEKNYYGETTFFEKNSDDTEIVAQVRPRYGRTVIFDGMWHWFYFYSYNLPDSNFLLLEKILWEIFLIKLHYYPYLVFTLEKCYSGDSTLFEMTLHN